MTAQQQKFVRNVAVQGMSITDAYCDAYPRSSRGAARRNGPRLMAKDACQAYKAKLLEAVDRGSVATLQERMEYLTKVIRTPLSEIDHTDPLCLEHVEGEDVEKIKKPDPLKAIAELNKMDGGYEPERHQLEIEVVIGPARED